MDEQNNNSNPFEEENFDKPNTADVSQNNETYQQPNPYNQQPQQNPYNQQLQQNPYNQQPQQNPYNQQPQQNPYQQQYGGYYTQPPMQQAKTGLATASMVLGIIGMVLGIFIIAFRILYLLPVLAIIFGIVHKSKRIGFGNKQAIAGVIMGVIALMFMIFYDYLVNEGSIMRLALEQIRTQDPDMYKSYYETYHDMFPQWFDGILMAVKSIFIK